MTLNTSQSQITYTGTGATTAWPFQFHVTSASDLVVTLYDLTHNTSTEVPADQYTVTGIGSDSGTVTFPIVGSAISASFTLTITRSLDYVQETELDNQSGFYPVVVEDALDYLTMLTQQNRAVIDSQLLLPTGLPLSTSDFIQALLSASASAATAVTSAQTATFDMAPANVVLTPTQANNLIFIGTGALPADRAMFFPATAGAYLIANQTTGAFNLYFATTALGANAVVIPQSTRQFIVTDGTNSELLGLGTVAANFRQSVVNPSGAISGSNVTLASVIWNSASQRLYVCTSSGTSVTAVWAEPRSVFTSTPGGYLSMATDTIGITASVQASVLYYLQDTHGYLPMTTNGTDFFMQPFTNGTQLTFMAASALAGQIHDVFAFFNSGVLTLCYGAGWSSGTGGSSSRGTAAGTTALMKSNGIWVNQFQMSTVNGANGYTLLAQYGTYLGTAMIDDGVAGQISCLVGHGQNRRWGVYNAYNRKNLSLVCGTSSAFTQNIGGVLAWNNAIGNSGTFVVGLREDGASLRAHLSVTQTAAAAGTTIGIGWNSSALMSGHTDILSYTGAITLAVGMSAAYETVPAFGRNAAFGLISQAGASTTTINAGEEGNALYIKWRG